MGRATIDPAFGELAADRRSTARRPPSHLSVDQVRAAANAVMLSAPPGPAVHEVRQLVAPGPAGSIPLRLYRPSSDEGLPLVVFIHGGGFTYGSIETHDPLCRSLAAAGRFAVLSVDYRLAPECPYPAAIEDCTAALQWAARTAATLGLDGERLALCGDSAGAHLALGVTLRARGEGPRLAALGLFYPLLDPACDMPSAHELEAGPVLSREAMLWFWENYLGDERDRPEAALLEADLRGLPPTAIAVAEADPLRDEGLRLAQRLIESGVQVELRRYEGMVHGFLGLSRLTPVAGHAIEAMATELAARLR